MTVATLTKPELRLARLIIKAVAAKVREQFTRRNDFEALAELVTGLEQRVVDLEAQLAERKQAS